MASVSRGPLLPQSVQGTAIRLDAKRPSHVLTA